jgi:hypothetical protein
LIGCELASYEISRDKITTYYLEKYSEHGRSIRVNALGGLNVRVLGNGVFSLLGWVSNKDSADVSK